MLGCTRGNDAAAADRLITSGTAPDSLHTVPGLAVSLFARVPGARTLSVGPDGAAVLRFDLEGMGGRVFARGLRNAVGLAVNPATRELWVSTHERDNIKPDHQDLPPEEIDILRDGGDNGWPYCHSDRVPNPESTTRRGATPPSRRP